MTHTSKDKLADLKKDLAKAILDIEKKNFVNPSDLEGLVARGKEDAKAAKEENLDLSKQLPTVVLVERTQVQIRAQRLREQAAESLAEYDYELGILNQKIQQLKDLLKERPTTEERFSYEEALPKDITQSRRRQERAGLSNEIEALRGEALELRQLIFEVNKLVELRIKSLYQEAKTRLSLYSMGFATYYPGTDFTKGLDEEESHHETTTDLS